MSKTKLDPAAELLKATRKLAKQSSDLRFGPPVSHVYNPLEYAFTIHAEYVRRYFRPPARVLFMGMNPGPFGMAQIGVPFGEIALARDWLRLSGPVKRPASEHPKRPIQGFDCPRSEVSGHRLWGLFRERFGTPARFFKDHYVGNYCPLVFMDEGGRNITPDKLPAEIAGKLYAVCDAFLIRMVELLQPAWIIGIGRFAEKQAQKALAVGVGTSAGSGRVAPRIAQILHPSPASPMANKDWAGTATAQLQELGIWK